MPQIYQITPFMYVDDIETALRFMVDVLGFSVALHASDYAYLRKGVAAIRILQDAEKAARNPADRRYAYYLDVDDCDALFAELQPKLAALPAGHVHGPADKVYGQRELCVLAPDGALIVFGAAIRAPKPAESPS